MGNKVEAIVNYRSGGKDVTMFVPLTFAYTDIKDGFDFYVATQAVRLYADPGTVVSLQTFVPSGFALSSFLTVSGYLI